MHPLSRIAMPLMLTKLENFITACEGTHRAVKM